jgi:hypothetical protein
LSVGGICGRVLGAKDFLVARAARLFVNFFLLTLY